MYEIKQTQGIKAKKYSIWLGLNEIVRSQSKVAVQKLLIHLNGEPNVRIIPTDLLGESTKLGCPSDKTTTDISRDPVELRDRDSLRCLDSQLEKRLGEIDLQFSEGVRRREIEERESEKRVREINSRYEEKVREGEIKTRELDRRHAETRAGFEKCLATVSRLASLSKSRLRNYENQIEVLSSSTQSQIQLEPFTINVHGVEIKPT